MVRMGRLHVVWVWVVMGWGRGWGMVWVVVVLIHDSRDGHVLVTFLLFVGEERRVSCKRERGGNVRALSPCVCVLSDPEREMFFCRPRELSSMGRREEEAG